MDDDFGIALSPKHMPEAFEFALELREIVNFAVENHPDGFFAIGHGLMPERKVDDRKPAETEAERPGNEIAFVIRPAMDDASRHPFKILAKDRSLRAKVKLSANAAHKIS
jgi:hypothetical protein